MTDTLFSLTTLEKYLKVLKNNVYEGSPLWDWLMKKNRIKDFTGTQLSWNVVGYRSESVGMFGGYSTVPNQPNNPLAKATLPISKYVGAFSVPKDEEILNSGPEQIQNMIEVGMQNVEDTMKEFLYGHVFGAGTAVNGLYPLQGTKLIITKDTGTYANLNRATATIGAFWNANTDDTAHTLEDLKDSTSTSYFPVILGSMYRSCSHGGRKNRPDFVVMDKDGFGLYEDIMRNSLRIGNAEANAAFDSLKLGPAEITYDDFQNDHYVTMLNSNDFSVYVAPKANFSFDKDDNGSIWKRPTNQLAKLAHIIWMGQIRCDAPRQQGQMTSVGAS